MGELQGSAWSVSAVWQTLLLLAVVIFKELVQIRGIHGAWLWEHAQKRKGEPALLSWVVEGCIWGQPRPDSQPYLGV